MNNLTPEQLEMLKKLQPKINEVMDKWMEGDMFYSYHFDRIFHFCPECHGIHVLEVLSNKLLRIPKVYDWQNPERGLWEMIDWGKYLGKIMPDGNLWIWGIPYYDFHSPRFTGDPFTALLKALCEQEGV